MVYDGRDQPRRPPQPDGQQGARGHGVLQGPHGQVAAQALDQGHRARRLHRVHRWGLLGDHQHTGGPREAKHGQL